MGIITNLKIPIMKKKYVLLSIILCCFNSIFAQYMTKEQLTNDVYNVVYGYGFNPDNYN